MKIVDLRLCHTTTITQRFRDDSHAGRYLCNVKNPSSTISLSWGIAFSCLLISFMNVVNKLPVLQGVASAQEDNV